VSISRADLSRSGAISPTVGALVDSLPEPVALVSPDGTIHAANRAYGRTFGWNIIQPESASLLDHLDTKSTDALEYLRLCASAGQPVPGALVMKTHSGDLVACRMEGWTVRPREAAAPALVALRFFRKAGTSTQFLELTRRIGDLSAEIARRRHAESQYEVALADLREVQQRLALLTDATDTLLGSLTVADVMQAIGALMTRLLPADAHAVWYYDEPSAAWRVEWQRGLSDAFVSEISNWSGSPPGAVPFRTPLAVSDVRQVSFLDGRRAVYDIEGIQSLFVIPLRLNAGNYGTVVAYFRQPHEFSEADVRVATALGNMGSSALTTARLYEAQTRSRESAELAEHRARFLAGAAETLASSMDYGDTLHRVARLAVPEIADWCAVDILDEDGVLRRLAVAHSDPSKVELARLVHDRYPPRPNESRGVAHVVRTGNPDMMSCIPQELLQTFARDAEHLEILLALRLVSYMSVPLLVQGRAIGALTFVSAESGRQYTDSDLRFAQEVASRASLAVENARAYEDARRANQLKDEFLATLSHELRTPLNAILGYTSMLRSESLPEQRRPHALEIVERNAMSLHQIVEDVLDVSRIVAGKVRLNVQLVGLGGIIGDALATIRPAAEAKGVRLEAILDPSAPQVSGDPDRLQQILWNLLSNAVKFTPRGGRVQVRLERVNSHVEIVVSDTGAGISPEFLPHIFERFRQGDSRLTREHGGLGLGLAISRHLVELHGGVIAAASDGDGKGTTFRVSLPAVIVHQHPFADTARVHPRGPSSTQPVSAGTLAGFTVLAVDDQPDALALVCEVLEGAGARVIPVTSAQAALETLERDLPDVILSDLGMPGTDGCEFVARVRQLPDTSRRAVPAAALTALARAEDRIRALNSGFQMHLAKPVNPAELVAAVRALATRADVPEQS
jgi:signal transduction histidine kinase/CheY-like chemotaxis protein